MLEVMYSMHTLIKHYTMTDKELFGWVYWIHLPEHTIAMLQGYVGITTVSVEARCKQHRAMIKHRSYDDAFCEALITGNFIVDILAEGNLDHIKAVERYYRPDINIGWNRAIGGDGGFNIKHGLTGSLVAKRYYNMLTKAKNQGIVVCDEWQGSDGLVTFYEDMGDPPSDEHILARRNIQDGFNLDNVVWETRKEYFKKLPCYNKVLFEGSYYTYRELGELLGIKGNTIQTRLKRGWSLEEATNQVPRRSLNGT